MAYYGDIEGFREPTADECTQHARLGLNLYACWYPQMGGYVGKCLVLIEANQPDHAFDEQCFEAWVWHDGEFPFSEDGQRSPAYLHHCSPKQFNEFGNDVQKIMKSRGR